ncbi:MAG TPA: carboxypeptidase-like regulatory domain-containing protein [Saprospiraceae bacterium]|nr:carboxypeptidase-like regulatory domain-containing protein [Saprospiraceae bacterium]HMQ82631.1 carboxypeptidase-like regulatory domain-containing protein [Saprospiraceae bacterium]
MRSIILFALLFSSACLMAQDYITYSGTITDIQSGAPLSYAHVGIPEKGIGATSGQDGSFVLKIPAEYANSTLIVSFIGYASWKKPLQDLSNPIKIQLRRSSTTLTEIIVLDEGKIEDIIRRAIRQIPANYPTHPTKVLGFYRESKTDKDQHYTYLAEGVLDIYKTSYRNTKEGQIGLVQGRQMIFLPPEEWDYSSNFSAGHMAALRFDFVKNREDFINEDYFDQYKYWLREVTEYKDRPVYVIGFDEEDNATKAKTKGIVYIDTTTYAFLRAEFEVLPNAQRKYYNAYPLYTGNWQANRFIVDYQPLDGKWYFSQALREGLYRDGGIYSNEILITEINPESAAPIPYLERLDREDEFLDLTGEYDQNFWRHYNTIPLNDNLQESVQQMRTAEVATEVFDSTNMARVQRQRDSLRQLQTLPERIESDTEAAEEDLAIQNPYQRKRRPWKVQWSVGGRYYDLATEAARYSIQYGLAEDGIPILSLDEPMKARNFEATMHNDFDLYFHKNFFFRWGFATDFTNSIFKERELGFGAQFNLLPNSRPLRVRFTALHNRLNYARYVGQAQNDFGKFEVNNKKYSADKVNLYYGSRIHQVHLGVSLALELNPAREIYLQAGYLLPFAEKQHLYLWERGQFFRQKERAFLNNSIEVNRNDAPFDQPITPGQYFFVGVGMVFK